MLIRGCAAVVLAACSLRAQTVHGRVESDGTKEPLSGGVVVAADAAGHRASAPAITNEKGAFALRFSSPGRYVLSVRRIGYRPVSLNVHVGEADTTATVRMSMVPLRLATVETRSRGQCRVRPTNDSTLWAMWSDAEVAMLNARIASGTGGYQFDAEFSDRTYDVASAKISEVALKDTAVAGGRPWASLPADSLDHAGFVSATERHMTFVGPDLSALLSPAFLDNHCFSIHAAASDDSTLVGLDFAPASITRHIDIRGTFWLNRSTAELRALTFYYDKLPYVGSDTLAGGRIEFAHVSTGAWVLTHWSIRTPMPTHSYLLYVANLTVPDAFHAERVVNARDPQFGANNVRVTGGSVRTVRHVGATGSAIVWTAPVSTLTVHVRERQPDSTDTSPAGEVVRLRGSNRQATTDKNGDATFPAVLDGEYILEAASPTQDAVELPPDRRVVVVRAPAPARVEARVMSDAVALHRACGGLDRGEGILAGRVIRDGLRADGEKIFVRAIYGDYPVDSGGIKADADGRFRACGVPKGEELSVSVSSPGMAGATARLTIPVTERFAWVRLDLGPSPPP
jgi:hypothetical protein